MAALLFFMLTFFWLILGCAEVAKYCNRNRRRH
jgi:hypothetical protein